MENNYKFGGLFGSLVPFQDSVGGGILSFLIGKPAWIEKVGWLRRSIFNIIPFICANIFESNDVIYYSCIGIGIIGIIASMISLTLHEQKLLKFRTITDPLLGGLFGLFASIQNIVGGVILRIFIGKSALFDEFTWIRRSLANLFPFALAILVTKFLKSDNSETIFKLLLIIGLLGIFTSIIKIIVDFYFLEKGNY